MDGFNKINSYRDLIAWKKSMELVKEVYMIASKLPDVEKYALSDQMRRASTSIPLNIAEGFGRRSSGKETAHFLNISQGSRTETECQLLIAVNLGYVTQEDIAKAMSLSEEVGKMLTVLKRKALDGDS